MKSFKEYSEAFYDKVTLTQINTYLKGMSRLISNKDLTSYLKKKWNLKKIKFNPSYTKILAIEEVECNCFRHELTEAEYQGKKVELNNPTRSSDGKKKFYVYVKNEKGNVIKLGFGDPNMEIKRDDPKRRKAFRARHSCDDDIGPKWKARYWSCYQWRSGAKVDN